MEPWRFKRVKEEVWVKPGESIFHRPETLKPKMMWRNWVFIDIMEKNELCDIDYKCPLSSKQSMWISACLPVHPPLHYLIVKNLGKNCFQIWHKLLAHSFVPESCKFCFARICQSVTDSWGAQYTTSWHRNVIILLFFALPFLWKYIENWLHRWQNKISQYHLCSLCTAGAGSVWRQTSVGELNWA